MTAADQVVDWRRLPRVERSSPSTTAAVCPAPRTSAGRSTAPRATSSYIRVPHLDPRADAAAYAVARAYRQFLDDLRDGTSHVPDCLCERCAGKLRFSHIRRWSPLRGTPGQASDIDVRNLNSAPLTGFLLLEYSIRGATVELPIRGSRQSGLRWRSDGSDPARCAGSVRRAFREPLDRPFGPDGPAWMFSMGVMGGSGHGRVNAARGRIAVSPGVVGCRRQGRLDSR